MSLHTLSSNTFALRLCRLSSGVFSSLFVCSVQPGLVQTLLESPWKLLRPHPPRPPGCETMTSQARKNNKNFLAGDHLHSSCVTGSNTASVSVPLSEQQCVSQRGEAESLLAADCWERFSFCLPPSIISQTLSLPRNAKHDHKTQRLVHFILLFVLNCPTAVTICSLLDSTQFCSKD